MSVQLEWAHIHTPDSEVKRITDYGHLPPGARPRAFCPECKVEVYFYMGEHNAHHFHHKASSASCPAANGEGALHWNAKMLLASIIEERGEASFDIECRQCGSRQDTLNLFPVHVAPREYRYGTNPFFQADIALLRNDQLFATVEIFQTHPCTLEKITYHDQAALPCVEIKAEDVLAWNKRSNLVAHRVYGFLAPPCHPCAERKRKQAERASERQAADERAAKERAERYRSFQFGFIVELTPEHRAGWVGPRMGRSYHVVEVAASRRDVMVWRAYYQPSATGRWFPNHTVAKHFERKEPDFAGEPLTITAAYLKRIGVPEFHDFPFERAAMHKREEFIEEKGRIFGFPHNLGNI